MQVNSEVLDREKVLLIVDWCENKFGKSEHWKKPLRLRVYKSEGKHVIDFMKDGMRGMYYNGIISIYLASNKTVKQLCETVIHEYKHYLMNDKEYDELKALMKKYGDYDFVYNHPHEKKANYAEKKWGRICYNELKSKLYRKI